MDKVSGLNGLRNKEFSDLCEYLVAFKLQKLGWKVYQPLIDRYIDIIATKKINNKLVYRTIQVKSSRVETPEQLNPESYGLTHEPKDLLYDKTHFFIWVFVNKNDECNFFMVSVKDFLDIRWKKLPKSSRRKHESLLMRNEWRYGTDRMHPIHWLTKDKSYEKRSKSMNFKDRFWFLERVPLDDYLNAWDKLNQDSYLEESFINDVIEAQEMDKLWSLSNKESFDLWKQNNKLAYEKLKRFPDAIKGSKKLDDTGFPE